MRMLAQQGRESFQEVAQQYRVAQEASEAEQASLEWVKARESELRLSRESGLEQGLEQLLLKMDSLSAR